MSEIAIEDVLRILRQAMPKSGTEVWDSRIIEILTDAAVVDEIKRQLWLIQHNHDKETAQAWQVVRSAGDRATAATLAIVGKITPKPFDTRSLLERLTEGKANE